MTTATTLRTDRQHNHPGPQSHALSSGSGRSSVIAQETLKRLFANSASGLAASLTFAAVLVATHWSWVSHPVLLAWWSGMTLLTTARALLVSRFKTSDRGTSPATWFRKHLTGVLLSGVGWGAAGILLFTPNSVEHQAFLGLILAGMAAGAVPIFSASRRTFLAFALPACLPIIAKFLLIGDHLHVAIGMAGLIFLGTMAGLAWTINRNLVRNFELSARQTQAETELLDLFEHTHDLIQHVAPDGRLLFVNRAWRDTLGYSPAEIDSLTIFDILHPEDHEPCRHFLQEVIAGKNEGLTEMTFRTKSGRTVIVEGHVSLRIEDGLPTATRGIFHNVTEHKRTEEALRASKELFAITFRSSPDPMVLSELASGLCLDVNDACLIGFGYRREDMVGRTGEEIGHWLTPEERRRFVERLTQTGAIRNMEARFRTASGALQDYLVSAELIDYNGTPCMITVGKDITERKQAEAALQASQDQIRQMQKMEAIGQLAGGIAHDFNNVLTAILGNAEIALLKTETDAPSRPNLARILEAGQRASHVVQQILTFTRQQDVSRTLLPLAPVVTEAFALLRATLPAGVELTHTCDAATPHVLANATQLEQVLMNLCTNAWHALGDKPGRIAIGVAPVTLTQPLSNLHATLPPGHYARLSVRDTGCGMAPETVARIFDPFFTTKPLGQGTGLGLSVVHGIVEGHDGAIVVETAPGQGTTFHLYFPAVKTPTPASEPAEAPRDPVPRRTCHLLYLDDEEMLVELVRALFEPLGYRVTGYTKPTDALAAIRADPDGFDAVVTDYNMPGLSGLEVARELADIRPTLPVVLVSGYLTPTDQNAALAANIKEIVYKPTLLQELGAVLTRLFDNQPAG